MPSKIYTQLMDVVCSQCILEYKAFISYSVRVSFMLYLLHFNHLNRTERELKVTQKVGVGKYTLSIYLHVVRI